MQTPLDFHPQPYFYLRKGTEAVGHHRTTYDIQSLLGALDEGSISTNATEDDVDEFFGNYQLLGEVGAGGVARVFRARHIHPGYADFLFALKLLHQNRLDDTMSTDFFQKEACILALLRHPNIVQTFEGGIETTIPFIAMEYMAGRDLWDVLAAIDRSPVVVGHDLRMYILGQALQGLAFAHAFKDADGSHLGLVHHDVNPANIFISYDGVVKLGDFGVANAMTVESDEQIQQSGKIGYFAPEQFAGKRPDQRVDVFAFGVTMYEVLLGREPFMAGDEMEALEKNRSCTFPTPRSVFPAFDKGLEKIILKSMAAKPAKRPGEAGVLLENLRPWLPPGDGLRLAVASLMRTLFLPHYIDDLRLRENIFNSSPRQSPTNQVAIVADNVELYQALARQMQTIGITSFHTPSIAHIEQLNRDSRIRPDAIFVDVGASGLDLPALKEVLSRSLSPPPVVALTPRLDMEPAQRAHRLTAFDLLQYPIAIERLQTCIWAVQHQPRSQSVGTVPGQNKKVSAPTKRVVALTDDAHWGARLRDRLEPLGYEVEVQSSAKVALKRLALVSYHCAFWDCDGQPVAKANDLSATLNRAKGICVLPLVVMGDPVPRNRKWPSYITGRSREEEGEHLQGTLEMLARQNPKDRLYERYQANLQVEMRHAGRVAHLEAVNISRGGMMLRGPNLPPVGTYIALEASLGAKHHLQTGALVVRIVLPQGAERRPGVGVLLRFFSERDESQWLDWLVQQKRNPD
jgi:serine/threonine protein kinase